MRPALIAVWCVAACVGCPTAGCFGLREQVVERGRENAIGRWRVEGHASAGAVGVSGTLTFTRGGVVRERLRVLEVAPLSGGGSRTRVRRQSRDRRYLVEPGAEPGAYVLVIGGRQRLPMTFTPSGRLLLVWPAEAGNGWANLSMRLELERDDGDDEEEPRGG